MRQAARRIVLVLLAMCVLTPIAPDHAVAHDPSDTHVLYGEVVTDRGRLRIDARRGPVGTAPYGVAWFTPTGGHEVAISIDCLSVVSRLEIVGPFFLPVPSYSHPFVYAAGWGTDGKRYRIAMSAGITPVVRQPFVTTKPATRPSRRAPCGASWPKWQSKWREGGILILA